MKKIIALALALTLVFALGATAYAENSTGGKTTISTSVGETYTLIIPDTAKSITWGITDAQPLGDIGLSAVRLAPNNQVTITLSGNDGLANSDNTEIKIPYAIKDGGNDFVSASFSTASSRALTVFVAQEAWDDAPAGSYSDEVTFTAVITAIT